MHGHSLSPAQGQYNFFILNTLFWRSGFHTEAVVQRISVKKAVLKSFANFTGKHPIFEKNICKKAL